MRTIWKYPLAITEQQTIQMPQGAKVLDVQRQGDDACLWAEVESNAPKEARIFWVFGTGHVIPEEFSPREHVGTFQLRELRLVFHVYEYTGES